MILNNYWNYYMNSQLQTTYQSAATYALLDDFDCLSMVDGEPLRVCIGGYDEGDANRTPRYVKQLQPLAYLNVVIGTGTGEVSATNCQLETDITSSLYNLDTDVDISTSGNSMTIKATISGTNMTGSSITLSEIGIYKKVFSQIYEQPNPTEKVLFIRHLLDNPKTVANSETFSLTFEWVES